MDDRESPEEWVNDLARMLATARRGTNMPEMGGAHNPLPTEMRKARTFVEDFSAAITDELQRLRDENARLLSGYDEDLDRLVKQVASQADELQRADEARRAAIDGWKDALEREGELRAENTELRAFAEWITAMNPTSGEVTFAMRVEMQERARQALASHQRLREQNAARRQLAGTREGAVSMRREQPLIEALERIAQHDSEWDDLDPYDGLHGSSVRDFARAVLEDFSLGGDRTESHPQLMSDGDTDAVTRALAYAPAGEISEAAFNALAHIFHRKEELEEICVMQQKYFAEQLREARR